LNIFFQVDFEAIRIMRSEDLSLLFAENIGEFMILGRDIRKIRGFYKFCRVDINV